MRKVFVVNNSTHNFEPAEEFGKVIFLSEGPMNRFGTNNMFRQFSEGMTGSGPGDYIVLCSLNVMNSIACAIFSHKHGTLNLLLFKDGSYIERNHVL